MVTTSHDHPPSLPPAARDEAADASVDGPVAPEAPPPPPPADATVSRARLRAWWDRRTSGVPAWVLLVELFIGVGWVRAGVEKVVEPAWWDGGMLQAFLGGQAEVMLPWYRPFAELVVAPLAWQVTALVVVLQLAVGAALLLGRGVGPALVVGVVMNLHFLAAGAVDPSAFYLLAQGAVLLWLAERRPAAHGADGPGTVAVVGWCTAAVGLPFVRTPWPTQVHHDPAAMFVTGGLLLVLVAGLLRDRRSGRRPAA